MHFTSLRSRLALALGLPIIHVGCKEAPRPEPPPSAQASIGTGAPAASTTVPPVASATANLRCKVDEVHEFVCGLAEPAPGHKANAPFDKCADNADKLEQFDEFTFVDSSKIGRHHPSLATYRFDLARTKRHVESYPGTRIPGETRCCYERCTPLPIADKPRTAMPAGHFPHEMCVPAPESGASKPASGAKQCPQALRLSVDSLAQAGPVDDAPFVRVDDGKCCYEVASPRRCPTNMFEHNGECRMPTRGRPLREDGRFVVASARAREGWRDATDLDVSVWDEPSRANAARAWTREGAAEHASVASFARLALDLMTLGAPADLVDAAHVAARDEIRHATLAYGLASRLAGTAVGPGPLAISNAAREVSLASLASECFVDGCVGETVAALEAAEAKLRAQPGPIRDALEIIAEDEARHAELAYRIVAWALASGDARVREVLARDLEATRDEQVQVVAIDRDDVLDERIGILSRATAADVRRRALREVVVPCAEAMLSQS